MKRLLEIISKVIIENIPFFIVLGILSLFNKSFNHIYEFKEVLLNYILPVTLCYSSGKMLEKRYGGIVGVIVLGTILSNHVFQSFLEPLIIGIMSGWITKKYYDLTEKLELPGIEMMINNLGTALLALLLSFVMFYLLPFYRSFQLGLIRELSRIVLENQWLPMLSILIEPAKVFFLNNLINHSLLSSLGFLQLNQNGKSVFFLLETNPGPGLGILICYYLYEKKKKNPKKSKEASSNIYIHFLGGIHEVYFAYVLRNLKLILALILGGMSGIYFFQKFDVGLVGVASPGSILLLLLLAPVEDKLYVLTGIIISTAVTAIIALLILKKNDEAFEMADLNYSEDIILANNKLEICVSCDAGMGSSAMGATLLKRKMQKEGLINVKVINSSIDSIPETANIIVVHRQLIERLNVDKKNKDIFVIDDFMDSAFYDNLTKKVKELIFKTNETKDQPKILENSFEKKEEEKENNIKRKILEKDNIFLGLKKTDKVSALTFAGEMLAEKGYVEKEYINAMLDRENISSTYLDYGIAIPHCTIQGTKHIKNNGIVILQYPYGINYGGGNRAYLIIAIASLKNGHIDILKKLAEIFDDEKISEQLSTAVSVDEIYESLLSLEEENVK